MAKANTEPEAAEQAVARLRRVCGACLPVAAAVLVCYSFASAAWRVRDEPRELAFVAASGALLAALLACLRRAERLAPDSAAGERRRLQAAVWALSAAVSCAFAYRVAAVMPPALAVVVWCMTAFVVLAGLFLLVLCGDQQQQQQQQYQALCNAGCDPAGDGKPFNTINPADALV
jgi:peptidoglycan/LPS O-acetylase OafA/YrhL